VPCFPAFGPEALEYRMKDSGAKILVASMEQAKRIETQSAYRIISTGKEFDQLLAGQKEDYLPHTAANDIAVYQYTSGPPVNSPGDPSPS